jgi:uncharacterized protein
MELSLFPLGSVLFPGMPLRLHIFEDRYKQMINECIEMQKPFGVVLIEEGREALGPLAKPHMIGTTAHITNVQRLPYGRMNILAIGRDRFRVNSLDTDKAYLQGDVDLMPFTENYPGLIERGGTHLKGLINEYLEALQEAKQLEFDTSQIPDDPKALAYLAAVLLQTESEDKQALLEIPSMRDFLTQLIRQYQHEVAILDILLAPPEFGDEDVPFSPN